MDCAIGIAKRYNNRFKIVTLDGQVMNPGGSMSGGSAAKGAGILSRANTIEELQDFRLLRQSFRQLRKMLSVLREKINLLKTRLLLLKIS